MDRENRIPVLRIHLQEALVPQDPRVVDQDVHLAEEMHGGLDDFLAPVRCGDIVVIGDRLPARGADLRHDPVGRAAGTDPRPVARAPEVVHDHLRASFGELERVSPPQAGAGAGDDRDASVEPDLREGLGPVGLGLRNGLPEIAGEAPLIVGEPAPKDHFHRLPHLAVRKLAVGEVGHEATAPLELDHTVNRRRVHRYGQQVAREGVDPGRNVGKFIIVLRVDVVALRIHADIHFRILGRPAVPALSADEAGDHPALAPEDRHRRLRRRLRPDSHLGFDQPAEFQELHVIVDGLPVFQRTFHPHPRLEFRDRLGGLEIEGVAPLAETGQQDAVPRPDLLQRGAEHQERMGRSGLPALFVHRVDHLLRRRAQFPGNRPVLGLEEAREDHLLHFVHRDPQLSKQTVHRLGNELRVALLAEPSLFPGVVVALAGAAVMVDKIVGDRIGPLEFGDHVAVPDEQRGRAVAEPHLVKIGRLRFPLVRGGHEDAPPASPPNRLEGGQESRRAGAER